MLRSLARLHAPNGTLCGFHTVDYGRGSQAGHVSSFVLVFPALSMRHDAKGHLDDVG